MFDAAPLSPAPAVNVVNAVTPAPASRCLDHLAVAARDGDAAAEKALLESLVEKLRPLVVFNVTCRARGALVAADIDDLVQDLILLLWKHDLARFDPSRAGFLTFANRRLRWHLADRARLARRDRGEELDDAELEQVIDVDRDPESLLASHEREVMVSTLEKVVAAAAGSDTDAKDVVVRCDLHGARLREVAAELGIHVSNACRARKRGLKHLARHLEALV
jgi:RNA polymerase sigma factor (sigma-70 family)